MIVPKNCTFSSQHSTVHVEGSFEHLAILFPPKLLNSSHIYKWPKTYFLQKVLLDSKKAFLSDLPNPFLRKVTIVYRSMSGKNNESVSWPKNIFVQVGPLDTSNWVIKNLSKLAKSLTRYLLKFRESWQIYDFSKNSRRIFSGQVENGSQLCGKSFTQIKKN